MDGLGGDARLSYLKKNALWSFCPETSAGILWGDICQLWCKGSHIVARDLSKLGPRESAGKLQVACT